MKKGATVLALLSLLLCASTASAAFVFFESFESGVGGWTLWQQASTGTLASEAENTAGNPSLYPLGNIQPESGSNLLSAHLAGPTSSAQYNGGFYKVIDVPTDVSLNIDGFWRCHAYKRNSQWTEVIVYDGVKTIVNGTDYNPGTDGNLANGEIMYKIYSNNDPVSVGWAGQFSNTPITSASWQYTKSPLTTSGFVSTTGKLTVILKYGHTSSSNKSMDWDDIYITPEPSALALLAVGLPFLRHRRRPV